MSGSANKVPWWFPDGGLIILFMILACYAVAGIALSNNIQSESYGVLVVAAAFAFTINSLISLLLRYSHVVLLDATKELFTQKRKLFVSIAFLVPIFASWAENGSLYGAFCPIDYWKNELRESGIESCDMSKQLLLSAAEGLQVTQNKQAAGLATTSELMSSIQAFKIMRDMHEGCVSSNKERYKHAQDRLNEIHRSGSRN